MAQRWRFSSSSSGWPSRCSDGAPSTWSACCSGRAWKCFEMARPAALTNFRSRLGGVDWERMATRSRYMHRPESVALYGFLVAVSLPIILPYFWLVTIAFSARTGVAETMVLWRSTLVLVPAVIAFWLTAMLARNRRQMWLGMAATPLVAAIAFGLLVRPHLHLRNFIFLGQPGFSPGVPS